MRDTRHHHADRSPEDDATPTHKEVGRSTLSQQLAFDAPAQRAPLFSTGAQWESIDPHEAAQVAQDSSHEEAQAGHLDSVDTDAALEPHAAGSDAEHDNPDDVAEIAAAETETGAEHRAAVRETAASPQGLTVHAAGAGGARHLDSAGTEPVATAAGAKPKHKAKHKARHKKHDDYHAPTSSYNRRVHSNRDGDGKTGAAQFGRPGVRVNGKDVYELAQSPAPRYRIVSGTKATKTDQLFTGDKIAINIAHVMKLALDGGAKELCVLAWEALHGPAWIPLRYIKGNTKLIHHRANKLAKHDLPAVARRKDYDHLVRYHFRDEPMTELGHSHPTGPETTQHISPRTTSGGNMLDHYTEREIETRLPADDPASKAVSPNDIPGKRRYYSVNLSLPQKGTPPVACDVASPNDAFFVPHGAKFKEKIAIYKQGKKSNKVIHMQPWVYGFLGKQENGKWVADHSRRGWVPLRDLIKK